VPADASAVVLNVTAAESTATGYLSLWPTGLAQPNVSSVNFHARQTVPNAVIVPLGGGSIDIFNAFGTTHVIVDVVGWYAAPG
jgi:hypothetical protein